MGAQLRLPPRGDVIGALLVALLASINFLAGLDQPSGAFWDESYYLTSTQRYRDHTAQFASHPPLGLMLIAAGDALMQPHRASADAAVLASDKKIAGERIPSGFQFASVRVASGVFAVIGAVLFFALMSVLTQQVVAALLLSNLYVFDNAFIAHFRAAHLDAFQIAFLLGALLCFAVSERRGARRSPGVEFVLGACCGLALMVKVSAAPFVLLPVMLVARRMWLGRDRYSRLRLLGAAAHDLVVSTAGCIMAGVGVFIVHVAISTNPPNPRTPAGIRDGAFVSTTYSEYLSGTRSLSPAVLLAAARDYSKFMAADFSGTTRIDPNGSQPFQWPLNRKTINYRWDSDGTRTAYLQLMGNPAGWAFAFLAILGAMVFVLLPARKLGAVWITTPLSSSLGRRPLMAMFLLLYAVFMAVHLYLGTKRVLYLYHYFPALLLAFCLVPLVLEEAAERWPAFRQRQHAVLGGVVALSLLAFLCYSPFTFHRPLTHAECERRAWLADVVSCRD